MLKRKLVKAGFFGHGAVFLMVSPFSTHINESGKLYNTMLPSYTLSAAAKGRNIPPADTSATIGAFRAPSIPLSSTATRYVKGFIKKNIEGLEAAQKRSTRYFSIIDRVFTKHEIPVELKYLAVVESGLKTNAHSKAGAKGSWQMMAQTARDLGLKVGGGVDERTHFYKSTVAAARYLKALYGEFGDWLLVVAAYNSGSGTVQRAMKKAGSRNFWKIQRYLPAETSAHVKHFVGTHYFFQEEGSLVVLTRSETKSYFREVASLKVKEARGVHEDSIIATR